MVFGQFPPPLGVTQTQNKPINIAYTVTQWLLQTEVYMVASKTDRQNQLYRDNPRREDIQLHSCDRIILIRLIEDKPKGARPLLIEI